MGRAILLVCALLILVLPVSGVYARTNPSMFDEDAPGPMLLRPSGENVVISQDGMLEFMWELSYGMRTDHYSFRLYKGYGGDLVFSQDVSGFDSRLSVPASVFEDGQTYTWVMQQVFDTGRKSDKSSATFTVHKQ